MNVTYVCMYVEKGSNANHLRKSLGFASEALDEVLQTFHSQRNHPSSFKEQFLQILLSPTNTNTNSNTHTHPSIHKHQQEIFNENKKIQNKKSTTYLDLYTYDCEWECKSKYIRVYMYPTTSIRINRQTGRQELAGVQTIIMFRSVQMEKILVSFTHDNWTELNELQCKWECFCTGFCVCVCVTKYCYIFLMLNDLSVCFHSNNRFFEKNVHTHSQFIL